MLAVSHGSRVIMPPQEREEVLKILHDSHPVIVKMKGLARSYIWCPKTDTDLEGKVRSCATCQSDQKTPAFAVTPLAALGLEFTEIMRSLLWARCSCWSLMRIPNG